MCSAAEGPANGVAGEVEQTAWLLGVNFTVQVVPAAGDRVLHVMAGQSDAVRRRGRQLYDEAWSWRSPAGRAWSWRPSREAAAQQTWENWAALEAADGLVEDGGAIAVCCDLADCSRPGRADHGHRPHATRPAAAPQGPARRHSARPPTGPDLDHDKVYLLSRLDSGVVEDLDMIPLAGGDEWPGWPGSTPRASSWPMPRGPW